MNTAFAIAYPTERSLPGQVLRPLIDPRAYLRTMHLLLMFPLGIGYFVFFVTIFAVGGSLVWTLIGPPLLLVAMFVSLRLGDLEAWMVNFVARVDIRRPPSTLEGVTSFRQRVWARAIDPSTWTGLVYEFAQFPIGIAGFVLVVSAFSVAGFLLVAPLIVWQGNEPLFGREALGIAIDTPLEALAFVPVGLLLLLLSLHLVIAFSVVHAMWAKLMLGSRSRRAAMPQTAPEGPASPPVPPVALLPPVEPKTADDFEALEPPSVSFQSQAGDLAAVAALTAREREVLLLLARGFSNADIGETCYISEGTVKTHVGNILAKLELRDRTQAVIFAYEAGVVRPGATHEAARQGAVSR